MLYLIKYFAIYELILNWMFWSFNIILIMIVFFSKSYNSNLRGTEETLLQNNPLDFLDKEIETPVTLRNLRASNLNLILLCIHSSSFLFLFILTFSFYVPNSECCDECPCDNENTNENSNNDNRTCLFFIYYQANNNNAGNGNANAAGAAQGGASFLIAIIILFIFYVIYCITYLCGKYVS